MQGLKMNVHFVLLQINKMISEIKAASAAAQYDSDEDTEDGTWEHKKRAQEMAKTLGDQPIIGVQSQVFLCMYSTSKGAD